MKRSGWLVVGLLLLCLPLGCGGPSLKGAFPAADAFPDWTLGGEVRLFDKENLYDLVNGQAESFFAYAFEQVAVQTYQNVEGTTLHVEIWRLATPADAFGLFSSYRGGLPVDLGNEGDTDPGRRLDFWQDRYNVRLFAVQPVDDAILMAFAQAIAAELPEGGGQPELLRRLPVVGLVERSPIFFRDEISIQNRLWLGGENLLGLNAKTDAVLARYDLEGTAADLLLVQYDDADAASAGLEALEVAGLDSLIAAQSQGELLGAVFGNVERARAVDLVSAALSDK